MLKTTDQIKVIVLAAALYCAGPSGHAQNSAEPAFAGPVLLEIIDGDTAFAVDPGRSKAWWIVGECRREIPMPDAQAATAQAQSASLLSRKMTDDVTIGRRQIALTQQFRFNLTPAAASVEVYNSVRGGWAKVPVRVNNACALDAVCQSKMELPDC